MPFETRAQLVVRQARDVRRMLQTFLIFAVATILVFFAAAAMARVIASNAWDGPAHGGDPVQWFERSFGYQTENRTSGGFNCDLHHAAALLDNLFPIFVGRFWILASDEAMQCPIVRACRPSKQVSGYLVILIHAPCQCARFRNQLIRINAATVLVAPNRDRDESRCLDPVIYRRVSNSFHQVLGHVALHSKCDGGEI